MTRVLFLWAPCARIYRYALAILHGTGDFRPWNVVRVGRKGIYALAIVLVGIVGVASVETVVWGYLLADALGLIAAVWALGSKLEGVSFDASMLYGIITYGAKDLLSSIAGRANYEVDQAIISTWLSAEALGLYRVALSGSKFLRPLSSGFKKVLFSDVSRSDTREEGERLIGETLRASMPVLGLASITAGIAMPFLMPLLFGSEYTGAIWSAQILCVAAGVMGVKQILYNGARGHGQPEIPLWCELVALAVTAVALFSLLPVLGIEGAAIASLLAYLAGLGMALYLIKPTGEDDESDDDFRNQADTAVEP
jgi:O-antigen/teichoic acid export membrane protein